MRKIFMLLLIFFICIIAYCQEESELKEFETKHYNLSDCISIAIENNSDLKIARNKIISAVADTEIAKSDYFPKISANNQTFETTLHNNSTMEKDTTINAELKLFDTGLRYLTLMGAKASEKQTYSNVFRDYQTVMYNIMVNYYNCQRYKELIDLKISQVNFYTEEEEEYKTKIQVGELAPVDIYPIQSSLADAKVALLNAKKRYEDSIHELIYYMGIPEIGQFDLEYESVETETKDLSKEEYIKIAIENRKDLKAGEYAIKTAKINKQKTDMELWPLFYVNAEFSDKLKNTYADTDKHTDGRIMGYISWNLFDGFNTQAKIKKSKANLDDIIESKVKIERDIVKNLRTLYTDITTSKEQLNASLLGFESANKNREVQKEKFTLNMNTDLDILNAQVQYDNALTNVIESKYDLKLSYIQLDYETGILGLDDERLNFEKKESEK